MILPPHTPCAELAADRLRREMEAQRTELRVMLALPAASVSTHARAVGARRDGARAGAWRDAMTTQTIRVAASSWHKGSDEVEAEVRGVWALHISLGSDDPQWLTVSHVPSGFSLGSWWHETARAVFDDVSAQLPDWRATMTKDEALATMRTKPTEGDDLRVVQIRDAAVARVPEQWPEEDDPAYEDTATYVERLERERDAARTAASHHKHAYEVTARALYEAERECERLQAALEKALGECRS